jgi:hypothetical protein
MNDLESRGRGLSEGTIPAVKIAGNPAEIHTRNLLERSLKNCRYTKPLGFVLQKDRQTDISSHDVTNSWRSIAVDRREEPTADNILQLPNSEILLRNKTGSASS